jgi:beta-lactam-binding protein with PASTA domain
MRLKELLTNNRIILKHFGLAILLTIILIWFTMMMLSLYTNRGESFPAPDFKGLSILQVQAVADKEDLRIVVQDSVFRKEFRPGTVVMQNPLAGHKIKPNRIIYLTLSSFVPDQVEVPKLTDVSLRQARVLLESKGFALGNVEFRPSEFNDLVLDQKHSGQSIALGSKLDNGSTIDLVVGKNMTDEETIVPDLTSLKLSDALIILKRKSLTKGTLIYDPAVLTTEDTLNSVIWKQYPIADSTSFVSPGISVDLWLKPKSSDSEIK